MHPNSHRHHLALLGGKIAAALVIIATLLITFVGPISPHVHAASLGSDPNSKSADSLPTNSPDSCFPWDGVQSKLNGAAPIEFIDVPNVGTIEIDDTVQANSCSKAYASNLFMSGLVYVHWSTWSDAMGTPPPITVTLASTAVLHGYKATWSAGVSANAGTDTSNGASAGASANFGFSISPSDSTILTANNTISNQQSAAFSYQNLSATSPAAAGSSVTQTDIITINVQGYNARIQSHNEQVETSFT